MNLIILLIWTALVLAVAAAWGIHGSRGAVTKIVIAKRATVANSIRVGICWLASLFAQQKRKYAPSVRPAPTKHAIPTTQLTFSNLVMRLHRVWPTWLVPYRVWVFWLGLEMAVLVVAILVSLAYFSRAVFASQYDLAQASIAVIKAVMPPIVASTIRSVFFSMAGQRNDPHETLNRGGGR